MALGEAETAAEAELMRGLRRDAQLLGAVRRRRRPQSRDGTRGAGILHRSSHTKYEALGQRAFCQEGGVRLWGGYGPVGRSFLDRMRTFVGNVQRSITGSTPRRRSALPQALLRAGARFHRCGRTRC